MDIEYMRTAKKSYMIVKRADFPYEPYELKMILQNDIPCLLKFQTMLSDGETEYWYDVSGMQSLKNRFLLESLDGRQIRFLLEGIMEMKSAMESYLLDDADICPLAETIYFDRMPERVRFCCIPGLGSQDPAGSAGQPGGGLRKLFEEVLSHLNHADPAAVRMGYEMYERCVRGSFTAQDCEECLRIGEGAAPEDPDLSIGDREIRWKNIPPENTGPRTDFENGEIELLSERPEQKAGHRRVRKREPRRRHARAGDRNEDEEMLFALRPPEMPQQPEDSPGTELISEDDAAKGWKLTYKGDGMESDIILSEFPFMIGSDARRVNGVLRARTVSRVHARLYLDGERLFAEDFNSTNGTYVNQQLLPMNTPVELKEGDRIVFATEEYVVGLRRGTFSSGYGQLSDALR